MIYSALAAVIVAALAWDFGRRCLAVYAANDAHRARLDDLGTQINARVREQRETNAVLGERMDELSKSIGELQDSVTLAEIRINELAGKAAESPDVAKFNKALENLWRETREELAKRPTHEDLKAAETRLHGVLSGSVAKGAKRFA